jgi:hypothetical protein
MLNVLPICFSQQEGVQEHGTDVPLVVHPLRWFFSLLERGSFHLVPFRVLWFIYDWQGFIIKICSLKKIKFSIFKGM